MMNHIKDTICSLAKCNLHFNEVFKFDYIADMNAILEAFADLKSVGRYHMCVEMAGCASGTILVEAIQSAARRVPPTVVVLDPGSTFNPWPYEAHLAVAIEGYKDLSPVLLRHIDIRWPDEANFSLWVTAPQGLI